MRVLVTDRATARAVLDGRLMGRLDDRAILITGSTGIGAATAERAAAEGARVFVVSRTADHARDLADRIGAGWAAADLTDEAQVDAAVSRRDRAPGPDRRLLHRGRRQRPAVRRRPDPHADRRRVGGDRSR